MRPYRSYRGRGRKTSMAAVAIAVVAVLAGLLVFGFVWVQDHLVYGEDGVYLDIPFLGRTGPSASPSPSPSENHLVLEIVTPSQVPSPSPTSVGAEGEVRALYLPVAALLDEQRLNQVLSHARSGAINTVIVELKDESGKLGYISALPEAITSGASAATSPEEALSALREEGVRLVARLSCFKDDLTPRKVQATAVKTSGVVWLDYNMCSWLNPYSQTARDYLAGILTEVSGLGFGEVLLYNTGFPVAGKTDLISYGSGVGTKQAAIGAFLEQMKDSATRMGMTLSVQLDDAVAQTGQSEAGGQSLSAIAASADRLYFEAVAGEDEEYLAAFDRIAGVLGAGCMETGFVPIVAVTGDPDLPQTGEVLEIAIDTARNDQNTGYAVWQEEGDYPSGLLPG